LLLFYTFYKIYSIFNSDNIWIGIKSHQNDLISTIRNRADKIAYYAREMPGIAVLLTTYLASNYTQPVYQ